MIRRLASAAVIAVALLAPGCTSPPESMKQKTPEGPQFDATYYAKNAKEYFDQGRYGQAKDQWQKQLIKDPENVMARMGVASCDLYLSQESVVQHRDMEQARNRLKAAEKGFRDMWGGQLEADTLLVDPKRPQWKIALLLAMTLRAQGYLDHLDAKRHTDMAAKVPPAEAAKAVEKSAELDMSSSRSYQDSIDLFNRLAYMQHASPEAIKNLAELYVVTKQDALAEQEFRRYIGMAARSRADWEKDKKETEKKFSPNAVATANELIDAKIASTADKEVDVRVDLAQLAWARADYAAAREEIQASLKILPERKDLYLKLAEAENKLDMLETAVTNLDEFLKRSSRSREQFDENISHALKLKAEIEKKLRERTPK